MPIYHLKFIKHKLNNNFIKFSASRYYFVSSLNLLYSNFFKCKRPEVNSASDLQIFTKCSYFASKKRSKPQGIILPKETLHCLCVPAKTSSHYNWSRVLFCRTEQRKWSKTAFVYKNLKSTSSSEYTNYELPTYRDDYLLQRLKLQSFPEAVSTFTNSFAAWQRTEERIERIS